MDGLSKTECGGALIFEAGKAVLVITGADGGNPPEEAVRALLAKYAAESGERVERARVEISLDRARAVDIGNAAFDTEPHVALAAQGRAMAFRFGEKIGDAELIAAQAREIYRLRADALIDPLTGIANRRHALIRLHECVHAALRHGQALAIALTDLDNFKACNRSGGHMLGDEVLRRWARIQQTSLRGDDFVARYGGDEFLAILPMTDRGGAKTMLSRMQAKLVRDPVHEDYGLSFSAGVAAAAELDGGRDPDRLLRIADRRLLAAKRSGPAKIIID